MSATVAIAHTAEKHRSIDRVLALVREALSHLGGMQAFVAPGQTVLIVPNQEGYATDPLVVEALIGLTKEAGAGRVQVAGHCSGAESIDLGSDDIPNRVVEIPLGKAIHRAPLPATLLDADVIIAVPKAKTHYLDPICGAMELWASVVNRNWRNFNDGDNDTICRFVDIMTVSRPDLCVTDALMCGEGDGPSANFPRWAGCILASTDPVATDVAIAQLMGLDWKKLRFAEEGESRELGERQPIAWLGVPIEKVCVKAWPAHEGYDYLPLHFLVGTGVSPEGTIGHVKSALDAMLRRGEFDSVRGTPTILLGDMEDPEFEAHLREGPYLVFDDAARTEHKNDPRVHFVPGHPVLRTALPELRKALGIVESQPEERPGLAQKAVTVAAPLAVAALAVFGGLWGVNALTRKKDAAETGR
jgi:uncharacterized protein (DUF362 family)